jgi:hypothetical protein
MIKNFTEKERLQLIEKVKTVSFTIKKKRTFQQRKLVDISLYEKALKCGYPEQNSDMQTVKKYHDTHYYNDIGRYVKENPCDYIITKGLFFDELDLNDLGVWINQKTKVSPFPKIDIKKCGDVLYYKILRSNIHRLLDLHHKKTQKQ